MGGDDDEDEDTEVASGDAPGWAAIERALARVHDDQEPHHWATILKWSLGGPDPLDGVSAYRCDRGAPHWHLVGYGLSELYSKDGPDPSTSGFGLELTLRLPRGPTDDEPPAWAPRLLQDLARLVVQSGDTFAPGQHLDHRAPIARGVATGLTALLFVADPELPAIDTPHGRLEFVQAVGITADELDAIEAWDPRRFADELAARHPLLITDPARPSLLADPAAAAAIAAATARDGSSMGAIFTDAGSLAGDRRELELTICATSAGRLATLMRGRLLHERPLTLRSRDLEVLFEPGPVAEWQKDGAALVVNTTPGLAREIAATLAARPGVYRFGALPGFAIRVALP